MADVIRELDRYQTRLRALAQELTTIGFISRGSLIRRHMRCGTPSCRCQADPPQLHGPYWQWTTKQGGKTVTRRLSEKEARLYRAWIANRRRLERIVAQMEGVSRRAAPALLRNASGPTSTTRPRRKEDAGR